VKPTACTVLQGKAVESHRVDVMFWALEGAAQYSTFLLGAVVTTRYGTVSMTLVCADVSSSVIWDARDLGDRAKVHAGSGGLFFCRRTKTNRTLQETSK